MTTPKLVKVSREEFFKAILPMNVHPRPEKDVTFWETPNREVVGESIPGYLNLEEPDRYYLAVKP